MAAGRHKLVAEHTLKQRLARKAMPAAAATLVSSTVVGMAPASTAATSATGEVSSTAGGGKDTVSANLSGANAFVAASKPVAEVDPFSSAARKLDFSRSAPRVTLDEKPVAKDKVWMVEDLDVRTAPADGAEVLTTLDAGTPVQVTGVVKDGFAEIVFNGLSRWVTAEYLEEEKPEADVAALSGELSTAPCAAGSSIESGLSSNGTRLYRAVCAAFPQITSYGGWRGDGEHSGGNAIDIMVSDQDLGWQIAEWLRANASALNLYDVIFAQRIWTPERGGEGWRYMSDRGSATANHYDHVHVATY